MWIKICGNTNLRDAQLALEAGADALGFVFAPSPRQVDSETVRRILEDLPPEIESYGVFAGAPFAEIVAAVEASRVSGVQLHGFFNRALSSRFGGLPAGRSSAEKDLPAALHEHFSKQGREIRILPVVSMAAGTKALPNGSENAGQDLDRALALAGKTPGVRAVLVDSFTKTAAGGTGIPFDWAAARKSVRKNATRLRIVVAGGLRPENVRDLVHLLEPWGVDVVSGVETSPGKKDPVRLREFIAAAREAGAGITPAG